MRNHIDAHFARNPHTGMYVARLYSCGRDVRGGMFVYRDYEAKTLDGTIKMIIDDHKSGFGALPHYLRREELKFTKKARKKAEIMCAQLGGIRGIEPMQPCSSTSPHAPLAEQGFAPVGEAEYVRAYKRIAAHWNGYSQHQLVELTALLNAAERKAKFKIADRA